MDSKREERGLFSENADRPVAVSSNGTDRFNFNNEKNYYSPSWQPVGLSEIKHIIHPEYPLTLRHCDPDLSGEAIHA
jgi:hypothetical protein